MTIPNRAIDSAIVSLSKVNLSNFVGMLLLVKIIALEGTLVIVNRVVIFIVQILESVRTGYTHCICILGRIKLRISLVISSQEPVVFYSIKIIIFLTFSVLSMTNICRVFLALAIVILSYFRIYSSLSDYHSIVLRVK